MSKWRLYRDGLGTLVGMIFGAGMFALPFVFSRAGIFWGVLHFLVAMFFMLVLHLMYGEVAYLTDGQMRFTGYVRRFFGSKSEKFALVVTVFSYYGTLLVYGLLGGIFLSALFPFPSVASLTLIFFAVAALLSLFGFERIGTINFYLTIPLFIFVFYLFGSSFSFVRLENFLSGVSGNWFLPYGVWLFALGGFASLPEARDIMKGATLLDFRRVIIWSLTASALIYFVFIAAVWGVSGAATSEDALSGLAGQIGRQALLIGAVIGFLAVFTSYLALAADFKSIFKYDYGRKNLAAWALTVIPAPLLYVLGFSNLVKTLGLVGAIGLGVLGIFIIEMARRLHKRFPEHRHRLLGPRVWLRWILIVGLLVGVFLEIWNLI
ncbi:MAG: hypothetical protein HYY55_03755 [Candidatus Niyogibacteria bacterium]|nr:MAG: hypothetical protein HYY55_03755 [Candidatus Niyogibacteria bacterium]